MIDDFKVFDSHLHYLGRFKPRNESILEYMDRFGIDKAAITTLNRDASLNAIMTTGNKDANNNHIIEQFVQKEQYDHGPVRALVDAHPERLVGFFWFNPKIAEESDWKLLRTYIEQYGFKGIKTQTFVDLLKIPEDLHLLAEFCIEYDLPLFIHSGTPFFFQKPVRLKAYYRLVKRYKELKVILGHSAFTMEHTISLLRYFRGFKNVFYETSCSIPYGIMTLIKAMGSGQVIYGSDAPAATTPDIEINKIRILNLPPEIARQVFYDNFNKLIGLTEE